MNEVQVNNLEELKQFCSEFSKTIQPGNVICLTGDLGAGKTTFVQCICETLNINDNVTSPTFNIMLQYKNDKVVINHFDLYRLEKPEELDDIAFYESVESKAITFIEWAEKFKDSMPDSALWIKIEKKGSESRLISVY